VPHTADISFADALEVLSRWWVDYDEGRLDRFADHFTADAVFTVAVSDPTVAWAEFATASVEGRDTVVAWQSEHRLDSPSPLRHHLTNVHLASDTSVEPADGEVAFGSYLLVNQVVDEMPNLLPSGVANGVLRREADRVRIARMDLVLDTLASIALRERRD